MGAGLEEGSCGGEQMSTLARATVSAGQGNHLIRFEFPALDQHRSAKSVVKSVGK